jgi:hypothetical protein
MTRASESVLFDSLKICSYEFCQSNFCINSVIIEISLEGYGFILSPVLEGMEYQGTLHSLRDIHTSTLAQVTVTYILLQ